MNRDSFRALVTIKGLFLTSIAVAALTLFLCYLRMEKLEERLVKSEAKLRGIVTDFPILQDQFGTFKQSTEDELKTLRTGIQQANSLLRQCQERMEALAAGTQPFRALTVETAPPAGPQEKSAAATVQFKDGEMTMKFTEKGVERILSVSPAGLELTAGGKTMGWTENGIGVYENQLGARQGKLLFKKEFKEDSAAVPPPQPPPPTP